MPAKSLAAALLLALAAPTMAATGAFASKCEATVPVATCGCMVYELEQSREGQIFLGVTEAQALPEASRQKALVALMNKHRMKASEMQTALKNGRPTFDAAMERCK